MCIQPPLQSPPKNCSSTLVTFHLPVPPLLVYKIIFTIPTNTPFLYTSAILHHLIFAYNHPNNLHQKYLPYLNHFANSTASRDQGARESCEDWHCFNISLPQIMDSDIRTSNPWFLMAQAQKIGVLQIVVSDEDAWNRNGKLSNPPSLVPSAYCRYFHTLLIPSQELAFPWKPVLNFIFILRLAFLYTIHVPLHPYV